MILIIFFLEIELENFDKLSKEQSFKKLLKPQKILISRIRLSIFQLIDRDLWKINESFVQILGYF